jgi:hypothetical protein
VGLQLEPKEFQFATTSPAFFSGEGEMVRDPHLISVHLQGTLDRPWSAHNAEDIYGSLEQKIEKRLHSSTSK